MGEISYKPGSPAVIEPATWRDLNTVRQIEKVCFPKDIWPLWDLIGVLTLPNVVRLRAMVDGSRSGEPEMVGFIAGDVKTSEGMSWIATVGVLPEYQRRGIGEALISACEARVGTPRIRLSVRISNEGAIRLYLRLGYHKIGTWPAYYVDREDALVMEKYL